MENNHMNISSGQYYDRYAPDGTTFFSRTILATIDGVEMSVPLDPANRHYAEIMRQVEAGELTIADAE